ncbi:MAG: hypothetical protein ABI740_09310 [Alphaproteobacteria bacterium]
MKPAIGFLLVLALALGGCLSNPQHIARDTYDKTQGTQQASLPEPCKPGEQRTYRPTPKTDWPTYDSVIPPSSDVSSQLPSECRRRR